MNCYVWFRSRQGYALTILLFIGSLAGASGCGSSVEESIKPLGGATEIVDEKVATVDTPEAELFENAKRYYQVALYSQAKTAFEAIRDGYPLGPYAEFAEIKIADCEFQTGQYASAALLYEEFLKSHPASTSAPYVLMRAAQSYQLSHRGIGRDSSALHKALELYDQLLAKYPGSMHAELARTQRTETLEHIAAYEKMVIDFYRRKGSTPALESRDKDFEQKFGKKSAEFELSDQDEEQKWRGESFVLTGSPGSVQNSAISIVRAGRVIENSVVSDDSVNRVGSGSYDDDAANIPEQLDGRMPAQAVTQDSVSKVHSRGVTLRGIECSSSQQLIFLYLNQAASLESSLNPVEDIRNDGGHLELKIPQLTTQNGAPLVRDCFAQGDLVLNPNGSLVIKTEASQASVMGLSDPPRILVALR